MYKTYDEAWADFWKRTRQGKPAPDLVYLHSRMAFFVGALATHAVVSEFLRKRYIDDGAPPDADEILAHLQELTAQVEKYLIEVHSQYMNVAGQRKN